MIFFLIFFCLFKVFDRVCLSFFEFFLTGFWPFFQTRLKSAGEGA